MRIGYVNARAGELRGRGGGQAQPQGQVILSSSIWQSWLRLGARRRSGRSQVVRDLGWLVEFMEGGREQMALGSVCVHACVCINKILLIHEHGVAFHLLVFSPIYFISGLEFLIQRSLTSLVKFIPKWFIFLLLLLL